MPAPRRSSAASRRAKALAERTARVAGVPDSLSALIEQLVNRVIRPFDLVLLSRERIQETLDEAAERGRLTRSDANALMLELLQRGHQQTEDLLRQFDSLVKVGRRGEDDAAPLAGYDELSAREAVTLLRGLDDADQVRAVRDYERRHANRKSVLDAAERALRRG